ncbi:hypothetical protein [Peterkaempfera griseoplana]|uniref:hypothetical protein n=1 Tax=Peterkaempfera griseoplana TaxID=66896 RepID=UPI0006E27C05|nr:hypothetical protein [Peterkaempfera griseoplana]
MTVRVHLTSRRRACATAAASAALALTLAACGSTASHDSSMPGMSGMPAVASATPSTTSSSSGMDHDMPGMHTGDGLSDTQDGYRLAPATSRLAAGMPTAYRFTVMGPDGRPVTDFTLDQTERMHFYAVRSDLTGFQHIHPAMAPDGTWTAPLAALTPGRWRVYASFTPAGGSGAGHDLVLSHTVTVPGDHADTPLPAAASTTAVDGYTVRVAGELMAGMAHPLTVTITRNGRPVTDLQPYLDSYAHLTAFHEGDQAFAHLHPQVQVTGDHGGPTLPFHAELARSGNWRLFLQFRTGGTLHTAQLTLAVS